MFKNQWMDGNVLYLIATHNNKERKRERWMRMENANVRERHADIHGRKRIERA